MTESKDVKTAEVVIKENPNEFSAYANINAISVTPEEVVFNFGVRDVNNPNEAKSVAKIYLSLPHAKRIALVLTEVLTNYERMFGEILPEAHMRLTEEGLKRVKEAGKSNVSDNG